METPLLNTGPGCQLVVFSFWLLQANSSLAGGLLSVSFSTIKSDDCTIAPTILSMSSIKRDVKKKVLPRPESFSRSSPLNFHFSGEAWPIAHAHKFPPRMVAMPSSSRERQARLRFKVNHGSIRGSWPMAISGYPRGHNVIWVTRC